MIRLLRQLARYMVVGVSTMLLDIALLNLLMVMFPTTAPVTITLYSTGSYLFTLLLAYLWHRWWTFRSRQEHRRLVWRFLLLNGSTMAVNALAVLVFAALLTDLTALDALLIGTISKTLGTTISGLLNFLGSRSWVFHRTRRAPQSPMLCDARG